jgi:hypothetical protein
MRNVQKILVIIIVRKRSLRKSSNGRIILKCTLNSMWGCAQI